MYTSRLFQLLLVVVAAICLAQATWLDAGRPEGRAGRALIRRQDDAEAKTTGATIGDPEPTQEPSTTEEESAGPTEEPTSSEQPPPEETTSSIPDETTDAPEPTSTDAESTTAPPPETTSAAPEETTTSEDGPSTTSPPEETTSSEETEQPSKTKTDPKTTHSVSVHTSVEVVTRTNDDGSQQTMTTTSRTTSTPGLNEDDSDDDSGMTPKTRNTIIGVVVGVGGAIIIGALAIVAWRIWGRKKHAEESDTLMSEYAPSSPEKSVGVPASSVGSSGPQRNPFQSTLEDYHQPTPVNASSNF